MTASIMLVGDHRAVSDDLAIYIERCSHFRSRLRFVKALIVTPTDPPVPGRDVHGVYGRLRMLIQAFAQVAESIEILHLLNAKAVASLPDSAELERIESEYW